MSEYLIETMGIDDRWSIVCSVQSSGCAHRYMKGYQPRHPLNSFRVVEMPCRRIIVQHDPFAPSADRDRRRACER